jgi:hypothetical protein
LALEIGDVRQKWGEDDGKRHEGGAVVIRERLKEEGLESTVRSLFIHHVKLIE